MSRLIDGEVHGRIVKVDAPDLPVGNMRAMVGEELLEYLGQVFPGDIVGEILGWVWKDITKVAAAYKFVLEKVEPNDDIGYVKYWYRCGVVKLVVRCEKCYGVSRYWWANPETNYVFLNVCGADCQKGKWPTIRPDPEFFLNCPKRVIMYYPYGVHLYVGKNRRGQRVEELWSGN